MNPYAAPKAKLEDAVPAGTLWRDGRLVRMERAGALPERCVVCNQPSSGERIERTLYWSPPAWRHALAIIPVALFFGGIILELPILAVLFWPAIVVLGIANYFVRRRLRLELATCERHRRQRNLLRGLSVAAMVGLLLVFATWTSDLRTLVGLLASVTVIIALAVVQSRVGLQAISLKKLDAQQAWLGGTGRAFREALPEVPGA